MLQAVKQDLAFSGTDPFMNKMSVKGKKWTLAQVDENRVDHLIQAYQLPEIIARLLVLRDLDKGDIDSFLNPKLSLHFPDPFALKNMDKTRKQRNTLKI